MEKRFQKLLLDPATGKKYGVKDTSQDFLTPLGIIRKKDLQGKDGLVKSDQGKPLFLFEPTFPDLWELLQRGPQMVLQKDIGLILAKTGVNKDYAVVDAGGGSGSLCLSLANVCKHITIYENNPEHYALVAKNSQVMGIKNITLKQADIYQGIEEKEIDLLTLDLPEPWKVLSSAEQALKPGAHLVVYLPNLLQVQQFLEAAKKTTITIRETVELLLRTWKIEERIMRPEFEMLGHTGFLIFGRKMG